MSGKNNLINLISKKASLASLWDTIESIYGEIPEIIKLVLELNGFDSFLALRGIRYDDKNDFFKSLEATVIDIVNSTTESVEKRAILNAMDPNFKSFRLKPGHRNLIMNLMLEIDKIDVEEFFSKKQTVKSPKKARIQESLNENNAIIKNSPSYSKEVVYEVDDHLYTNVDSNQAEDTNQEEYVQINETSGEEYILEEFLEDRTGNFRYKVEDSEAESSYEYITTPIKKPALKRKPDRMYSDEFLSQCLNPRKRRVTSLKTYEDSDEGILERFTDLVQQSMQCILSHSRLEDIKDDPIIITKETDTTWIVACPLCGSKIKLPVVYESNGRYRNYKRSNFERHLRFKHCKEDNTISEAVLSIQQY